MNWDRIILGYLLVCSILLFTTPYIIQNNAIVNDYKNFENTKWATITDKVGDKITIEPLRSDCWSIIEELEGKDETQLTTISGKIERYDNIWGFRFQPESIRLSWSGYIVPSVDLTYLPTLKWIQKFLPYYLDNTTEIVIERIEGYDIKTTFGLTYNTYEYNYLVLQIVSLSLIGICSTAIITHEIVLKIKKKKLVKFLQAIT